MTNDINLGLYSQAQIQAAVAQTIADFRAPPSVRHLEYSKIMPRTNTANTAPLTTDFAPGAMRDSLNAWLDSQIGPSAVSAVFSFNDLVEDPANPGLWLPSLPPPADGTHPAHSVHQGVLLARMKSRVAAWTPGF